MAQVGMEASRLLLVACFVSAVVTSPVFMMDQGVGGPPMAQQTHRTEDGTCGYDSCDLGEEGMLNVHMVPHTHDDVGWLKTVDQYFYGSKLNIQRAAVQYILDSVVRELVADPNKRFIYVEIAFFYRWWNEQDDSMRHVVKGLVNSGQLQFILGGWCMNDEASTHYNAIIDQHTVGFKFLKDNFGDCGRPHVGWQIDPFGHSREQASLFAQFGFDGLFFGRLDYQDKDARLKDKRMELMWFGSDNLGDQGTLFTGVNFNGYGPPPGFCFDVDCGDDPIMDDKRLNDYNVDDRVKAFMDYVKDQAKNYTTNHIMLTMGSDFQFKDAHINYKNMDKLMKYVNAEQAKGSKVNAFYSTPNCYLKALNNANQTYTSKGDDFFPYAHRAHSFWTGYFTSRAALKFYVRQTNNFLQVCKQLEVLAQLEKDSGSSLKIQTLAQAMGVAQHHDAVSGTEKQAVAYDYAQRLGKGIAGGEEVIQTAYQKLIPKASATLPTQNFCTLSNITKCSFTESGGNFVVTVYNPIARSLMAWVKVPVLSSKYTVEDSNQKKVPSQFNPVSESTMSIPERNGSKATGDLVFQALLPPLGFKTYFLVTSQEEVVRDTMRTGVPHFIKNQHIQLHFDSDTGLLKGFTNLKNLKTSNFSFGFMMYESMPGNNSKPEFQASGAYVFRPKEQDAIPLSQNPKVTTVQGVNVQEVHQSFGDMATQVIRLYDDAQYLEFEWTVGPINISDKVGKEVIVRYTTDLKNDGVWYTDANGRELLKRVRDFRPTWNLNQTEPVAGNYYPVNSRIAMQDISTATQFTVLTDRSQGGASIKDGTLELMLHRRTLFDDHLGVGEPLNETGSDGKGLIVRGKHYIFLDTIANSGKLHRDLGERLFMAPVTSVAQLTGSIPDYVKDFQTSWSGLYQQELPANVHMLTLEGWTAGTVLLRLEHFYEQGDDPQELSKPVRVSLKGLFRDLDIESVTELTLGGDQNLADAKRLVWNVAVYGPTKSDMSSFVTPIDPENWTVTLKAMQIRTFQISLK